MVPQRETGMSAYEMMLSESQERMLMVLRPDRQEMARGDFREMGARFRGDRPADRHRPDRGGTRGNWRPTSRWRRCRSGAALHRPTIETAESGPKLNPAPSRTGSACGGAAKS
jgi:hypothetical protein